MRALFQNLIVGSAVFALAVLSGVRGSETPSLEKRVRYLLSVDEFKDERRELIELGQQAFPIFKEILGSANSRKYEVERVLNVLREAKTGREEFLDLAVDRLADTDWGVRVDAVKLVGSIGRPGTTAPIVLLLSDKKEEVGYAAARTLAEIGAQPERIALKIWMENQGAKAPREMREEVRLAIERIDMRLKTRKPDKHP